MDTTTLYRTIEFSDGSTDLTLPTEIMLWNDDPIVAMLSSLPEGAKISVTTEYGEGTATTTYRKV